jgi:hypothetical protein
MQTLYMRHAKAWMQLVLVLCVGWVKLSAAAEGRTNSASLSTPMFSFTLEQPERNEVILDRFFEEVVASDSFVFDRFVGPSCQLGWLRKQDALGYASLARINADGASMFASIGLDSLRTAALEALPLDLWQDHFETWIGHLILGTIGNPEEEHFRTTSIGYSAVRTSWETANQRAGIQWGFRPWRTSPYIYVLAHAGHWNGQTLITFEGRAGYTLFGATRLEGRVALPLPAGFRISGGVSADPGHLGSQLDTTRIAVTLERVIRSQGSNPEALFYIGFRSGMNRTQATARQENLLAVGLSRSW